MRCVRALLVCVTAAGLAALAADAPGGTLRLNLRTRVEAFKGSGDWQETHFDKTLPVARTAILICDMWDKHWCTGASRRVDALAARMAPVIDAGRARGIQIVHAPSETMEFYKDAQQRRRILAAPRIEPPSALTLSDPPLPIDDSNGGCDTPDSFYKAWTRENSTIHIAREDVVSDNGAEIYSFLRGRGIENLLVMGVHTNMCILNRSFAIRQMTKWGMRCVLVRDLTDSMYNPRDRPFVSHERGTELVIEHIEKYWAPTVLSAELARTLRDEK
jgi:nicotinamidase-related amidase